MPDGKLWLVIADVCGKGVPAALQASSLHAAVHAFLQPGISPGEILGKVNTLLLRREIADSFVTALIMRIDPRTGETVYASAGHPAAIAFGDGLPAHSLAEAHGFMLGVFPEAVYANAAWQFSDLPTSLLMYTDGVSEAANSQEEQFGEDHLLTFSNGCQTATLEAFAQQLCLAIEQFRGGLEPTDDLTLLLCRRE